MRSKKREEGFKESRKPLNRYDYENWDYASGMDALSKERYGPKEKSTVRKVMVPVSLIIKLWKRLFK